MAEPRFIHLRVHSDYSMIDGLAKVGPLVKKVAALGMPAFAITDHTNMCGLVKFYGSAHGAGIKPIIGADVFVKSELLGDELSSHYSGSQQYRLPKSYSIDFARLSTWVRCRWTSH